MSNNTLAKRMYENLRHEQAEYYGYKYIPLEQKKEIKIHDEPCLTNTLAKRMYENLRREQAEYYGYKYIPLEQKKEIKIHDEKLLS